MVAQKKGKGKMKVVGFKKVNTYEKMGSLITDEASDLLTAEKAHLDDSLDSIESIGSNELSDNFKKNTLDEKIKRNGLSEREIKLFKLLKEHYVTTNKALMKTCLDYDHY
jgi:hypothetical protein